MGKCRRRFLQCAAVVICIIAGSPVSQMQAWANVIQITAPSVDTTVSGIVPISCAATPDVKWVNFYIDESWIASSGGKNCAASWNSSKVADGSYNLSLSAYGWSNTVIATSSQKLNKGHGQPTPTPTPIPTPTPTNSPTPTPTPAPSPTPVAGFDQYGGVTNVTCPNGPRPHFYTEKIGDRWWMCDPAGNGFFMKAVTNVSQTVNVSQANLDVPAAACSGAGQPAPCCTGVATGPTCGGKYWANIPPNPYLTSSAQTNAGSWTFNWIIEQINRLRSWGFNTIAEISYAGTWPTRVDTRWNTSDHTIPAQFRMPFALEKATSHSAFSNQGGCGLTSPIKDMLNGLTSTNKSLVYYDFGDFFDPDYATCVNGQANPANDPVLKSATQGPHNDYLIYITIDEGDQAGFSDQGPEFVSVNAAGMPNKPVNPAAHPGWVTLSTAPTQSSNSKWSVASYSDHEVYSKVRFADLMATKYTAPDCSGPSTPFAACTGSGTAAGGSVDPSCTGSPLPAWCMGDTYIGAVEMGEGLARLNLAWGSDYTTLSTSDSNCSTSLSGCLQPGTYSSWGAGTGLLDEDGSCPSRGTNPCWIGNVATLTGETAAMQADMSAYLTNFVHQYYSTVTNAFHTYEPGVLIQMTVGGWGAPPRREVLQQAAHYLDLPQVTFAPVWCPTCTDIQQRIDFTTHYLGDRPWIMWEGSYANPDSSESQHVVSTNISNTQQGRGAAYQQMISNIISAKDTIYNSYHVVGFYWWDEFDMNKEGLNWGLLSVNDNAYDGCSASIAGCGTDKWGYPTGGETANYGDVLSDITDANNGAIPNMPF